MDKTLLYQPSQTLRVWIALFVSVSLHAAAVAIAQMDRELIPTAGVTAPADPIIDFVDVMAPEVSPPEIEPVETPSPVSPNDESIPEIASTPSPKKAQKIAPPLVRTANVRTPSVNPGSARVLALSAPRPEYPYEARRQRLTGDGVAMIAIDAKTGLVLNVTISKSTGNDVLDQATLAGLRRWRFKTGAPAIVRCPITFTLTGAAF